MDHYNTMLAKYGPLVEACAAYGISRATAFDLVSKGMLETFLIGNRRYVMFESLWNLPHRLAATVPR